MTPRDFKYFPVKAGAKAPPLIVGWQLAATNHTDQIKTWQIQFPGCNWAIHCEDLLVLDVDVQKGGEETLKRLETENEPLPETLRARTPSGGQHIFFTCHGGAGNSVERLGAGVDVRSDHGYVLVQPSRTELGAYEWSNEHPCVPAPEWLVQACAGRPRTEPPEPAEAPVGNVDAEQAVQRAQDWLKQTSAAVQGEGGDQHTFAVACKLRDFGVPLDRMMETLQPWNARCEPPWSPEELYEKCRNAHKYGQNPPAAESVEALFEDISEAVPESVVRKTPVSTEHEQPGKPATEPATDLYGPTDITLPDVLISDYLVKGWLDRGIQAQLFGPWGAGKTFCALHLGVHVASGHEWFGQRVRPGGVLYCGYEGARALRRRLYALTLEYPDWDWSCPFRVMTMQHTLSARGAQGLLRGQSALQAALKSFPGGYPALIIVDPLRNALGGSDSDPDLTEPFLQYMRKVSRITNATVLTVHHPGHGDPNRGRGDSGIEAAMDAIIHVEGETGKIYSRKQRDEAKGSLYYRLKVVQLGTDDDGDEVSTCVASQVEPNPMDPNLTTPQQELLDKIRGLAGDDLHIARAQVKAAAQGKDTATKEELIKALRDKLYLLEDSTGKGYLIGNGAAEEVFN